VDGLGCPVWDLTVTLALRRTRVLESSQGTEGEHREGNYGVTESDVTSLLTHTFILVLHVVKQYWYGVGSLMMHTTKMMFLCMYKKS